ncbi:hypothetical protein TTHERM_00467809 (macronuclear) [Tetrahymena thermophila SB210]|uniref:Uncharacterized protein n=1 Tax=Tetrahymena thermophila (strain SB210) TaxID=312017 RepID=A4VCU3_TETTS|nr:hypothetical protein TTHERM_00467809 [Tetrahymena thermophila SB210]EDK31350.2 hypothetical protein TTHERM_00467809 [Tetrahymena thermophila SB210]|eukprot:XP_001471047.2 hypothetical protein TTHERM_00467809 [Tetrahymena thermophila SB210]
MSSNLSQNQTIQLDDQSSQHFQGDITVDPEVKNILQSQIINNTLIYEESQLIHVRLIAKVETFLGIENIIQVEGFQASYTCKDCGITNFDEKSKSIICNCSQKKLYMKDKFVPIINEKSKKSDKQNSNDISLLFQFSAVIHGEIKFNYLKFLIKCKKCAETSYQILDLSILNQSKLNKQQINQLQFNFQAMCNKCCSIQYFSITNLEVKYDILQF